MLRIYVEHDVDAWMTSTTASTNDYDDKPTTVGAITISKTSARQQPPPPPPPTDGVLVQCGPRDQRDDLCDCIL